MNICPVCALTGHLVELQVVRVIASLTLSESVDWYWPRLPHNRTPPRTRNIMNTCEHCGREYNSPAAAGACCQD